MAMGCRREATSHGVRNKDNDAANLFWETQGYTARTNLDYRNKSMNKLVPTGK